MCVFPDGHRAAYRLRSEVIRGQTLIITYANRVRNVPVFRRYLFCHLFCVFCIFIYNFHFTPTRTLSLSHMGSDVGLHTYAVVLSRIPLTNIRRRDVHSLIQEWYTIMRMYMWIIFFYQQRRVVFTHQPNQRQSFIDNSVRESFESIASKWN